MAAVESNLQILGPNPICSFALLDHSKKGIYSAETQGNLFLCPSVYLRVLVIQKPKRRKTIKFLMKVFGTLANVYSRLAI